MAFIPPDPLLDVNVYCGGVALAVYSGGGCWKGLLTGTSMLQRLRRLISLDYYTIPPATQARLWEVRCGAFC